MSGDGESSDMEYSDNDYDDYYNSGEKLVCVQFQENILEIGRNRQTIPEDKEALAIDFENEKHKKKKCNKEKFKKFQCQGGK